MTIVAARELVKTYEGRAVVDGVDFSIEPGECFGLLGPNGAGKTTTLRMLLGLTHPSAGDLTVLGYRIPEAARPMRARVGVVPQTDALDPDFTVRENLLTWASYFGQERGIGPRVDELIRFAALEGREDAGVSALSGGMRRRLSLARALVNDPELVVLDEPTTGLDPQARQHIWQRLRRLRDDGRTLILTTHYMEEAERLCDRLAIVDGGRIVAEGRPRDLIANHIEPCVLELRGGAAWQWGRGEGIALAARSEDVGDTLLLYAHDDSELLASLGEAPTIEYLSRRANLEDVFLRLTGHELRD
ncbi:ATP-binding cassette domain-containing protein [Halofilum ochraceum]|uniref:ATP-binding cassette domain-containing protein n=1 Tax=Halofilum ochraceum TaxID=1611323 RepID=UPI00083332FF|nr:ATP-binding cassette domain-containing protein [Halofilum ochraceum]